MSAGEGHPSSGGRPAADEPAAALALLAALAEVLAAAGDERRLLAEATSVVQSGLGLESCRFVAAAPGGPGPGEDGERRLPGGGVRLPLRAGDRLLGVLEAARREPILGAGEERLLAVVAAQVAGTLDRLRSAEELRRTAELYKDSEARFRCLSEASFEALLLHEGGRIVDANRAACELGGYTAAELVGRDAFEIIAPEYHETVYRNLLAEHDAPYEVEAFAADGSRLAVEVQARSLPYRGQVLRVVAVRDLTARKLAAQVSESLVRELEARNAELERFGYAVSHDLKAPIVTVKGFADHLERDARAGRGERVLEDVRHIREAVDRLQRLVEELMSLSRAARPIGPPSCVAADELAREALRLLGPRLASSGVRVELASPLPVVYGDRARLVQVFSQLLEQSLRFAAGAAPAIRIEQRPAGAGKVCLAVRDNGLPPEARGYDGAFSWPDRLEPGKDGAGVGLFFVRRVVESHGGRVWLEPQPSEERGSVVCFTLPQPPPGAAGGRATPAAERPQG